MNLTVFFLLIEMNSLQNSPVTSSRIDLGKKIFDKDIANIKGEATHQKPTQVACNVVEIPFELMEAPREVDFYFDTIMIRELLCYVYTDSIHCNCGFNANISQ